MRRILILSYGFPPRGGGGVQRTAKFAKYLPEFGWAPTVLTPDWGANPGRRATDAGLASEVSGTEVAYTGPPCQEGKYGIWGILAGVPVAWRFATPLKVNLQYPDFARTWIQQAVRTARPFLRSGKFDVIYSTSPPVAAHVAAMALKREFDVPWIADFRDPWTDNVLDKGRVWPVRRRMDRRLERKVYGTADRVIANTPTNRDSLLRRHRLAKEKVVTIPNGYDECDFTEVKGKRPTDFFRVTYCGSAYGEYNPEPFVAVLARFIQRYPEAVLKWTVAGTACRWAERIDDRRIRSRLELLGYIPHVDVPGILTSSHLLLHAYPPGLAYSIPGKLYEYVRSGTPVVAICDRPSEVERVLQETGRGKAFHHNELDEAANYVAQEYSRWRNDPLLNALAPDNRVMQYDRRRLTARLAEQLAKLVTNAPRRQSGVDMCEPA